MNYNNERNDLIIFRDIYQLFQKTWKKIIVFSMVIMFMVGLVTYFFIPKQYQSSITFYFQDIQNPGNLGVINGQLINTRLETNNSRIALCGEIITARQFLAQVLKTQKIAPSSSNINGLRGALNVENRSSGAIRISILWPEPVQSYNLIRTVFHQYKQVIEIESTNLDSSHRRFIEEQLCRSRIQLDETEQKLLEFQEQYGTCLLPEQAGETIKQYADYERQKAQVRINLAEARRRYSEAEKMLNNEEPKVKSTINEIINPVLYQYKMQLMDIESALVKARQNYTDQSPNVKNLLAQQDDLLKRMAEEKEKLHSNEIATRYLESIIEMIGLEARQNAIEAQSNTEKEIIDNLPAKLLTYGRLVREQKAAEQVYLMLLSQAEQAVISERRQEKIKLMIIDAPIVPDKKYSPSTLRYTLLAGITAFFGGIGFVLLKEGLTHLLMPEIDSTSP